MMEFSSTTNTSSSSEITVGQVGEEPVDESPPSPSGAYFIDIIWCWQETQCRLTMHPASSVIGSLSDCMIAYPEETNKNIESAFLSQGGSGKYSIGNYDIDFETMKQTNLRTGYQRNVKRVIETAAIASALNSPPLNSTAAGFDTGNAPMASCSILPSPSEENTPTKSSGNERRSSFESPGGLYSPPRFENTHGSSQATHNLNKNDTAHTEQTIRWCWRETSCRMSIHPRSSIVGDPSHCWIAYDPKANRVVELAFQKRKFLGNRCSPLPGYSVDFDTMKQTNNHTGFKRDIHRFVLHS